MLVRAQAFLNDPVVVELSFGLIGEHSDPS